MSMGINFEWSLSPRARSKRLFDFSLKQNGGFDNLYSNFGAIYKLCNTLLGEGSNFEDFWPWHFSWVQHCLSNPLRLTPHSFTHKFATNCWDTTENADFPSVQPIAHRVHGRNALVIRKCGSSADDPSRTVLKKPSTALSSLTHVMLSFSFPSP